MHNESQRMNSAIVNVIIKRNTAVSGIHDLT